jgi:hypothetical protein
MELAEPAPTRTMPPADYAPTNPPSMEQITTLFAEIGMHIVDEPDLLRSTPSTYP